MIKLFWENDLRIKTINYSRKKALSYIFVFDTPLFVAIEKKLLMDLRTFVAHSGCLDVSCNKMFCKLFQNLQEKHQPCSHFLVIWTRSIISLK